MIGKTIAHYTILEELARGGMGVVYLAEDTELQRRVAVKVLSPEVACDEERLARFEREARAVAALNHPNILGIHDFGTSGELPFAVMELLEGQTLKERLKDGRMPRRKAIEVGLQIARGLAAAHDKGIVHRDLKPENVFITREGQVKILDFGLAKLLEERVGGDDEETIGLTDLGRVLGTVAYMSPEQVRGESVDERSDIFSFGAIFYEMLTRRAAFDGDSAVETMNAVLTREPPELQGESWTLEVDRFVRHCLEKDPLARFQSAHDLAFDLETLATPSASHLVDARASGPVSVRRWGWPLATVAVALMSLVAGAVLERSLSDSPPEARQLTFSALTYSGRDRSPAASPDGRLIAFTSDRDDRSRIWLQQLSGGGEAPLTDGPDDFPRFSPDGSHVLFVRSEAGGSSLYRVPLLGGVPRKLIDNAAFGDWSPDGNRIAFIRWSVARERIDSALGVAAADGSQLEIIELFEARALAHPRWSPDGRRLAATSVGTGQQPIVDPSIFIAALDGSQPQVITAPGALRTISSVAWLWADELVYIQAESVVQAAGSSAQIIRQRIHGNRPPSRVWSPSSSSVLDLTPSQGLVFDTRSPRENLLEVAIDGTAESSQRWLSRGSSTDRQPIYSPDGEWIVFSSNRGGNLDLWAVSTTTGELRRLTDDPADDWDPAFLEGGSKLLWSTNRTGHFECWTADLDGANARQVTDNGVDAENPTATPDGAWIVYVSTNPAQPGIWKIRPDGSEATLLLAGNLNLPEASPDGRYALYSASHSPEQTVVRVLEIENGAVVPFEIRIERYRASAAALGRARWMPDGRSIAFIGQDEIGANGVFVQDFAPGRDTTSSRRALAGFDPQIATESFGVSPDGSRIVLAGWEQLFGVMLVEGLSDLGG
jgi:serine/threonine protein kinase